MNSNKECGGPNYFVREGLKCVRVVTVTLTVEHQTYQQKLCNEFLVETWNIQVVCVKVILKMVIYAYKWRQFCSDLYTE
jgi:hypothetical protein